MFDAKYIFAESQYNQEQERLQKIQQVCDRSTKELILATGLTAGWRCLEVGAGAGSIMKWMADLVGKAGTVVAVDIDTRFIANTKSSNVEVIEADIKQFSGLSNSFDLIHARYVLIHLVDFQVALSKMLNLLKPGGWLVIEEPDFSVSRAIFGEEEECKSVNKVNQAIYRMFADRGIDYSLGIQLPAIFQELGLQQLTVKNEVPLSQGASGVADVMKLSAIQLADQYIATGEVNSEDIQRYCRFAENQTSWAVYRGKVGVAGRKSTMTKKNYEIKFQSDIQPEI